MNISLTAAIASTQWTSCMYVGVCVWSLKPSSKWCWSCCFLCVHQFVRQTIIATSDITFFFGDKDIRLVYYMRFFPKVIVLSNEHMPLHKISNEMFDLNLMDFWKRFVANEPTGNAQIQVVYNSFKSRRILKRWKDDCSRCHILNYLLSKQPFLLCSTTHDR